MLTFIYCGQTHETRFSHGTLQDSVNEIRNAIRPGIRLCVTGLRRDNGPTHLAGPTTLIDGRHDYEVSVVETGDDLPEVTYLASVRVLDGGVVQDINVPVVGGMEKYSLFREVDKRRKSSRGSKRLFFPESQKVLKELLLVVDQWRPKFVVDCEDADGEWPCITDAEFWNLIDDTELKQVSVFEQQAQGAFTASLNAIVDGIYRLFR